MTKAVCSAPMHFYTLLHWPCPRLTTASCLKRLPKPWQLSLENRSLAERCRASHLLCLWVRVKFQGLGAAKEVPKDLLLRLLIKTADLSNTVKPFQLAHQWAKCVTEVCCYGFQGLSRRYKRRLVFRNELSYCQFLGTDRFFLR